MKLKTQRLKNKIMKRFKGTKGEWGTMFIKNGTQRAVRGEGGITFWLRGVAT